MQSLALVARCFFASIYSCLAILSSFSSLFLLTFARLVDSLSFAGLVLLLELPTLRIATHICGHQLLFWLTLTLSVTASFWYLQIFILFSLPCVICALLLRFSKSSGLHLLIHFQPANPVATSYFCAGQYSDVHKIFLFHPFIFLIPSLRLTITKSVLSWRAVCHMFSLSPFIYSFCCSPLLSLFGKFLQLPLPLYLLIFFCFCSDLSLLYMLSASVFILFRFCILYVSFHIKIFHGWQFYKYHYISIARQARSYSSEWYSFCSLNGNKVRLVYWIEWTCCLSK